VLLAVDLSPLANAGAALQGVHDEYLSFVDAGGSPEAFVSERADSFLFDGDDVYVEVRSAGEFDAYAAAVESLGFVTRTAAPDWSILEGFLPLGELETIATMEDTISVLPVWMENDTDAQGSEANEAETVLQTDFLSGLLEVDGIGVTVGVVSDSANLVSGGISASQATGDLPPLVPVLIPGPAGSIDEGRAMMELIYDIAPGAHLVFASGSGGDASMGAAIDVLAAAGADIIVDDLNGLSTEPYFQDGIAAQAVTNAVGLGATYFNSAGNRGAGGYDTPDNFAGMATVNGTTANWHDFDLGGGTDRLLRITLEPGRNRFIFQYDQPFGAVTSDLDIRVFDTTGTLLASGLDFNTTTQVPREIFQYNNTTGSAMQVDVGVNLFSGPAPTRFKFIVQNGGGPATINEHQNEPGAFVTAHNPGHNGTLNAISVAASPWFDPTAPEDFTSQGPVTRTLSPLGEAIPLQVLDKPIITSVDGTSTSVPGFSSFFGTSAAAPNAAAVAALLLELDPSLTPNQIGNALTSTAQNIGAAGYDLVTGFGLINALDAALGITGGVVTVNGDRDATDHDDTFPVEVNAGGPDLIDVTLNGTLLGSFDRNDANQLNINGLSGDDTLTVDTGNGLVDLPQGIRFDGGATDLRGRRRYHADERHVHRARARRRPRTRRHPDRQRHQRRQCDHLHAGFRGGRCLGHRRQLRVDRVQQQG